MGYFMNGIIMVLNAGSSSLKFATYEAAGAALAQLHAGQVEGIGATPHFVARDSNGLKIADELWPDGGAPADHAAAFNIIITWLEDRLPAPVVAIGHRVVHGGPDFSAPILIDLGVMAELQALVPLAPLHQPHNLAGITAAAKRFRGVPQVACFDTAFHRTQPFVADTYGLPPQYHAQGIRRFGFHGLSYEYIAGRIAAEDPGLAKGRLVVAHLGNGSSLCAIANGRAQASSMGFTAVDGVPMGTRCGQLDPGVMLYLLQQKKMCVDAIADLLYKQSGLLGLSGLSNDMRVLEASDDPAAKAAIDYFVFRIRREIGGLAASLGGLDALIFCGGIGENSRLVRARVCDDMVWIGIAIDPQRNEANETVLSAPLSPVEVMMIPTNEEIVIARAAFAMMERANALRLRGAGGVPPL